MEPIVSSCASSSRNAGRSRPRPGPRGRIAGPGGRCPRFGRSGRAPGPTTARAAGPRSRSRPRPGGPRSRVRFPGPCAPAGARIGAPPLPREPGARRPASPVRWRSWPPFSWPRSRRWRAGRARTGWCLACARRRARSSRPDRGLAARRRATRSRRSRRRTRRSGRLEQRRVALEDRALPDRVRGATPVTRGQEDGVGGQAGGLRAGHARVHAERPDLVAGRGDHPALPAAAYYHGLAHQARVQQALDRDEEGVEIEAAQAGRRRGLVHDPRSVREGGPGQVQTEARSSPTAIGPSPPPPPASAPPAPPPAPPAKPRPPSAGTAPSPPPPSRSSSMIASISGVTVNFTVSDFPRADEDPLERLQRGQRHPASTRRER